jgi:hypothetical protein
MTLTYEDAEGIRRLFCGPSGMVLELSEREVEVLGPQLARHHRCVVEGWTGNALTHRWSSSGEKKESLVDAYAPAKAWVKAAGHGR